MLQRLAIHPDSQCDAVDRIVAEAARPRPGALLLRYEVAGRVGDLGLPDGKPGARADELWRHTCFEAFVRAGQGAEYVEFNFAPSGEWCAHAFAKYREGAPLADEALQPNIAVHSRAGRLELDASIRLDRLSAMHPHVNLALALSAVVEDEHGGFSWWALKHAPGKPDFHHPDSFVLELP